MSVDETFQPIGPTVAFAAGSAAAQIMPSGTGMRCTTVRVHCLTAGWLTWGASASLAAAAAPAAAPGSPNTLGFTAGQVEKIDIPGVNYFRNDSTGVFELTAGIGGN